MRSVRVPATGPSAPRNRGTGRLLSLWLLMLLVLAPLAAIAPGSAPPSEASVLADGAPAAVAPLQVGATVEVELTDMWRDLVGQSTSRADPNIELNTTDGWLAADLPMRAEAWVLDESDGTIYGVSLRDGSLMAIVDTLLDRNGSALNATPTALAYAASSSVANLIVGFDDGTIRFFDESLQESAYQNGWSVPDLRTRGLAAPTSLSVDESGGRIWYTSDQSNGTLEHVATSGVTAIRGNITFPTQFAEGPIQVDLVGEQFVYDANRTSFVVAEDAPWGHDGSNQASAEIPWTGTSTVDAFDSTPLSTTFQAWGEDQHLLVVRSGRDLVPHHLVPAYEYAWVQCTTWTNETIRVAFSDTTSDWDGFRTLAASVWGTDASSNVGCDPAQQHTWFRYHPSLAGHAGAHDVLINSMYWTDMTLGLHPSTVTSAALVNVSTVAGTPDEPNATATANLTYGDCPCATSWPTNGTGAWTLQPDWVNDTSVDANGLYDRLHHATNGGTWWGNLALIPHTMDANGTARSGPGVFPQVTLPSIIQQPGDIAIGLDREDLGRDWGRAYQRYSDSIPRPTGASSSTVWLTDLDVDVDLPGEATLELRVWTLCDPADPWGGTCPSGNWTFTNSSDRMLDISTLGLRSNTVRFGTSLTEWGVRLTPDTDPLRTDRPVLRGISVSGRSWVDLGVDALLPQVHGNGTLSVNVTTTNAGTHLATSHRIGLYEVAADGTEQQVAAATSASILGGDSEVTTIWWEQARSGVLLLVRVDDQLATGDLDRSDNTASLPVTMAPELSVTCEREGVHLFGISTPNLCTATLSDALLNITSGVRFTFDGTSVTDQVGQDGWSATIDSGDLTSTGAHPLLVEVLDASGNVSTRAWRSIVVIATPTALTQAAAEGLLQIDGIHFDNRTWYEWRLPLTNAALSTSATVDVPFGTAAVGGPIDVAIDVDLDLVYDSRGRFHLEGWAGAGLDFVDRMGEGETTFDHDVQLVGDDLHLNGSMITMTIPLQGADLPSLTGTAGGGPIPLRAERQLALTVELVGNASDPVIANVDLSFAARQTGHANATWRSVGPSGDEGGLHTAGWFSASMDAGLDPWSSDLLVPEGDLLAQRRWNTTLLWASRATWSTWGWNVSEDLSGSDGTIALQSGTSAGNRTEDGPSESWYRTTYQGCVAGCNAGLWGSNVLANAHPSLAIGPSRRVGMASTYYRGYTGDDFQSHYVGAYSTTSTSSWGWASSVSPTYDEAAWSPEVVHIGDDRFISVWSSIDTDTPNLTGEVWADSAHTNLEWASLDGSSWTRHGQFSNLSGFESTPKLASDGDGTASAVWLVDGDGVAGDALNRSVRASVYMLDAAPGLGRALPVNHSWQAIDDVLGGVGEIHHTPTVARAGNRSVIAWTQGSDGDASTRTDLDLWVAVSNDSESFDAPWRLSTAASEEEPPAMRMVDDHTVLMLRVVHPISLTGRGSSQLWLQTLDIDTGILSSPTLVSDAPWLDEPLLVAGEDANQTVMVWRGASDQDDGVGIRFLVWNHTQPIVVPAFVPRADAPGAFGDSIDQLTAAMDSSGYLHILGVRHTLGHDANGTTLERSDVAYFRHYLRADLSIELVEVTHPEAGNTSGADQRFRVTNSGRLTAEEVEVTVHASSYSWSAWKATLSVGDLAPGESAEVVHLWRDASNGTLQSLYVRVDENDTVAEYDENDNSLLAPNAFIDVAPIPGAVRATFTGWNWDWSLPMSNPGVIEVCSFPFQTTPENPTAPGSTYQGYNCVAPGSQGSVGVSFSGSGQEPPPRFATLHYDADHAMTEVHERDDDSAEMLFENAGEVQVFVELERPAPRAGEGLVGSVWLWNTGAARLESATVEVTLDGAPLATFTSGMLLGADGVEFALPSTAITPGRHEVVARVTHVNGTHGMGWHDQLVDLAEVWGSTWVNPATSAGLPVDGHQTWPHAVVFTWQPTPGAAGYRLEVLDNATGEPLLRHEVAADVTMLDRWLDAGSYDWRVTSIFTEGETVSDPRTLTILASNTQPFSLTAPADAGEVFEVAGFEWNDVLGETGYTLTLAPAVGDDIVVALPEDTTSFTRELLLGTWTWSVEAHFRDGTSLTATQRTVLVVEPTAVSVTAPLDGAFMTAGSIQFSWPAPVGSVDGLAIEVSRNPGMGGARAYAAGATDTSTSVDLGSGVWYWRLAVDFVEGRSVSPTRALTLQAPQVGLIEPATGSAAAPGPVAFSWTGRTDVVEWTLSWGHGTSMVGGGSVRLAPAATGVEVVLGPGNWTWQITAVTDWAEVLTSPQRTLSISEPEVRLLAPANGAQASAGQQVFSWTAVDGAQGYLLELDLSPDFDSASLLELQVPAGETSRSVTLLAGSFHWRVTADLGTLGLWVSAPSVLHVATGTGGTAGPPVTLLAPEDGATIAPSGPLEFSWQPVTGATEYILQIDVFDSFSSPVRLDVTTTDPNAAVALPQGTFVWRVLAVTDDATGVSETREVTLDADAGEVPEELGGSGLGLQNSSAGFESADDDEGGTNGAAVTAAGVLGLIAMGGAWLLPGFLEQRKRDGPEDFIAAEVAERERVAKKVQAKRAKREDGGGDGGGGDDGDAPDDADLYGDDDDLAAMAGIEADDASDAAELELYDDDEPSDADAGSDDDDDDKETS